MEPIEEYLGPDILPEFDAVFGARRLKVLGYYRNTVPANWKMYHENLKDPYHATLLHAYLVSFGLMVAGNKSAMVVDRSGRHGTMASAKPDTLAVEGDTKKEMRAFHDGLHLADPRIVDYVREFQSPWSVTMQTIWPNMIVQRELNTLGTRQIVPHGPQLFTMIWTMFGYEGDSEEMTRHRLRQGNLMGPAGFLGLEDNEAMKFVQDGLRKSRPSAAVLELGGKAEGTAETLITEAAIRSLYRHWREAMAL
jgi:anthranilate 1,2-dioxygenase large subunit